MSILKPTRTETDFMDELEAAVNMRPARPVILMLFAIIGLITFLLIWAGLSEIEELTRGEGKVVPTKNVQVVQSLEGGVIQDILVKEGEAVTKGQVLLRISDVLFSSQERGAEARTYGLQAKRSRLRAEIDGKAFEAPADIAESYPDIAANERALYQSRQSELQGQYKLLEDKISQTSAGISEASAQISRLTSNAQSLEEELRITQGLVRAQAVPKLEEIRLEREMNDMKGQISAQTEKRRGLQAEQRGAQTEKANLADRFRSESLAELSKVESELAELSENMRSISDRVDRAEIRSPVDGVVNRLTVNTIGGVVEPAQPLAEVVPVGDELKVIAKVTPEEIAFIRIGLPAKVKLSAYDAQKYGSLDARLTRIGANSITDEQGNIFFEIEVQTDRNYLGEQPGQLPILPGMVATVEVITGKRTILEYLIKPVLKAKDRALTER
jgi:adhesin transport system membrane fusion protein